MNRLITQITIGFMLLCLGKANAQSWELVGSLPPTEFTAIKSINGQIYAAAENKLYSSSNGRNWKVENIHTIPIIPTCITVFNNILYVGTIDNGVYFRNVTGDSPWSHALLGLPVGSFLEHEGRLHLCCQGSGVWRNISGTWNNMTYNLPTYSYNVSRIISVNGNLLALAGANGTFYRFDPATLQWAEDYYSNTYQPGLIIDDALVNNNVILAANGHRMMRSEDNGEHWTFDNTGLINGINRILFQGSSKVYSLTLDPNSNFTYMQSRNINAPAQTSWGNFNEVLEWYTYAMAIFEGNIYMASDQGVFVKADSALDVEDPIKKNESVLLFPSITSDGNFKIMSDCTIKNISAFDISGKIVVSKTANALSDSIYISGKGIYLVRITTDNQTLTRKVVVQ